MSLGSKQILIEGMPPITLVRGGRAPIEEQVRMVTGYSTDDFVYELENNPKYKGVIRYKEDICE